MAWLVRVAVLLGVAWVLRKIATTLAVGLARTVADGGAPWLMWGAAVVWIAAAYRCGRPGWEPKQSPEDEAPAADGDDAPTASAPAEWPPISPVELVAAVRDIGTPHAQLKPLAAHLRTTTDAVRAAAAAQGWPVKDVRMQGRSASAGLAWPPPELPPLGGVVGAGQRADDNDDDSGGEGPEKGLRVVRTESGLTVYDLAERHRRRFSLRKN